MSEIIYRCANGCGSDAGPDGFLWCDDCVKKMQASHAELLAALETIRDLTPLDWEHERNCYDGCDCEQNEVVRIASAVLNPRQGKGD